MRWNLDILDQQNYLFIESNEVVSLGTYTLHFTKLIKCIIKILKL